MSAGVKRTVIILVGAVALVFGLVVSKVTRVPEPSSAQLYEMGLVKRDNRKLVAPFSLIDHRNEVFDNERLKGQWSLIFFGYTFCPDICPITLAKLKQLQQQFVDEGMKELPQVVMVTVDPARDTPERLEQYVTYFNPDFVGITGELQPLYDFALSLNSIFAKVPLDEGGNYLMDHSGNIVVVTPKGEYYGFFKPPFDMENVNKAFQAIAG